MTLHRIDPHEAKALLDEGYAYIDVRTEEEFSEDTAAWRFYWRFTNRYIAPIAIGIVILDLLTG